MSILESNDVEQVNWDSEAVKSLRRRMGWSQTDLARRLELSCSDVQSWEAGFSEPSSKYTQLLKLLFDQAELSAFDVLTGPQIEIMLEQKSVEMIETSELIKNKQ